ncbi:MAG: hypothetical protein ACRCSN_17815 [Dermatophilaceae bacterium]
MTSTTTPVSIWRGTQTDDWSGFVFIPLSIASLLGDDGWTSAMGVVAASTISMAYAVQLLLVRLGRGGSWPTPPDPSLVAPTFIQVVRVAMVAAASGCGLARSVVDAGSTAHDLITAAFGLIVGPIAVICLVEVLQSYTIRRARAQHATVGVAASHPI